MLINTKEDIEWLINRFKTNNPNIENICLIGGANLVMRDIMKNFKDIDIFLGWETKGKINLNRTYRVDPLVRAFIHPSYEDRIEIIDNIPCAALLDVACAMIASLWRLKPQTWQRLEVLLSKHINKKELIELLLLTKEYFQEQNYNEDILIKNIKSVDYYLSLQ